MNVHYLNFGEWPGVSPASHHSRFQLAVLLTHLEPRRVFTLGRLQRQIPTPKKSSDGSLHIRRSGPRLPLVPAMQPNRPGEQRHYHRCGSGFMNSHLGLSLLPDTSAFVRVCHPGPKIQLPHGWFRTLRLAEKLCQLCVIVAWETMFARSGISRRNFLQPTSLAVSGAATPAFSLRYPWSEPRPITSLAAVGPGRSAEEGSSPCTFSRSGGPFCRESMGINAADSPNAIERSRRTCQGAEVARVYVGDSHAPVPQPRKERKCLAKVSLRPGQVKPVTVLRNRRAFSYYELARHASNVAPGDFAILVESSSADMILQGRYSHPPGQDSR
jgi:hypothetical protein